MSADGAGRGSGPGPDPEDIDPEAFEDLPSTDVDVEVHVHFGMTGSFPLRLAELFFADDGLYIAEYSYVTPLFGLGTKQHKKEAAGMERIYDVHGLDEVLLQADKVVWSAYDNVERVVLDEGGGLGRPKLTIYLEDEHSFAYRLHEGADPAWLRSELGDAAERHGFGFEAQSGVGFRPRENLRRFFTG
ncbi:hypothetical protein [Halospeciosus flavus]|uniref:Uncharacterized protein n=2 Tax=Halospeciosus flavus TaxID=3032283 RepID=A0ABD5Z9N1_9EURY|nr:hypothetical protein [Halospeciosus flavus]